MTNSQVWSRIYSWQNKYNDYSNDYWFLCNAKNSLSESINGIELLYDKQYKNITEHLEDALGDQVGLKTRLNLTKSGFANTAQDTCSELDAAIIKLADAMEEAQQKIRYYYNQLD